MKLLLTVIALSVGIAGSAPAYASEWWYVSSADDDRLGFIDLSTMVLAPPKVTYWAQYINKQPRNGVKSIKQRTIVSCTANTIDPVQSVSYGPDGSVVKSSSWPPTRSPEGIVPDSIGATTKNFVCGTPAARLKIGVKLNVSPEQFAKTVHEGETPPE